MKSNEDIKHLLDYLQSKEEKALVFDEEAITSVYQKEDDHQSLAIKIVSVFGGMLSNIAFLGFLFITGLYDSGIGLLIFGILCIASSIWISKVYDKIIMDTLSVSSFAMGFFLLAFGMFELEMRENTVSIIFIVVALLSLSIVQNYILSCSAILIINGSILTLIIANNGYDLVHIYVSALAFIISYLFLKESKIITMNNVLSKLYTPARIGLILSFLAGLIILGKKGLLPLSHNYIWLSSVVIICAIIFLISIILETLSITAMRSKMYTYIFSILLLLPTALSPAISGSLLIILLSFLVNHKSGLVVGIIAFIYFISQYYYDLNLTLLTKSILLFSTGVMFIVLYLFTHKKLTSNE